MNVMQRYMLKICYMVVVSVVLFSVIAQAEETSQYVSATPDSYWSLLGGYGISHKDLGKTKVQVQVLDVILQYVRVLLDDVGSGWC